VLGYSPLCYDPRASVRLVSVLVQALQASSLSPAIFSLSSAAVDSLCIYTVRIDCTDYFGSIGYFALRRDPPAPEIFSSIFFSDPSARRHRPRLAPLPLDSGASHAPIGGSIQQSYCTQSYHALSSVISRRRGLIPRPLAPGSVALPLTIDD
jgi:hypothetical protein